MNWDSHFLPSFCHFSSSFHLLSFPCPPKEKLGLDTDWSNVITTNLLRVQTHVLYMCVKCVSLHPLTINSSRLTPFPRPFWKASSLTLFLLLSGFLFNLFCNRTRAAPNSDFMKYWKLWLMSAVLSVSFSSHMSAWTRGRLYPFTTILKE